MQKVFKRIIEWLKKEIFSSELHGDECSASDGCAGYQPNFVQKIVNPISQEELAELHRKIITIEPYQPRESEKYENDSRRNNQEIKR